MERKMNVFTVLFVAFTTLAIPHCAAMEIQKETKKSIQNHFKNLSDKKSQEWLKQNFTASLYAAVQVPTADPLEFLLAQKPPVNQLNVQNEISKQTPLHVAVKAANCDTKHLKKIILLIEAGADINIQDMNSKKPLDLANNTVEKSITAFIRQRNNRLKLQNQIIKEEKKERKVLEEEWTLLSLLEGFRNFNIDDLSHVTFLDN